MTISVITITSSLSMFRVQSSLALTDVECEVLVGVNAKQQSKPLADNKIKIYFQSTRVLGIRKNNLISLAKGDWILLLDTDEIPSKELLDEIKDKVTNGPENIHGYEIPYQNYVFEKPVYYGGERYSKVRLFRKKYGTVTPVPIHEEVVVQGKIGKLNGVLRHYSYRNPWQVLVKFTRYAWLIAGEKNKKRESVTVSKLFLYGPHMFWARCIEEDGWRDGWRGVVLAKFFGYMEGMTYWLLLWRSLVQHI